PRRDVRLAQPRCFGALGGVGRRNPVEGRRWIGGRRAESVPLYIVVSSGINERDQGGIERGLTRPDLLQRDPAWFKYWARGGRRQARRRAVDVDLRAVSRDRPVLQQDPIRSDVRNPPQTDHVLDE